MFILNNIFRCFRFNDDRTDQSWQEAKWEGGRIGKGPRVGIRTRSTTELYITFSRVIISCLDSHSNGTHSLQSDPVVSSDVMLNFSKSVLMHNILDGLRVSTFSFLGELFL